VSISPARLGRERALCGAARYVARTAHDHSDARDRRGGRRGAVRGRGVRLEAGRLLRQLSDLGSPLRRIEDERGEKYRQFRLLPKAEYKNVVNSRSRCLMHSPYGRCAKVQLYPALDLA
jgi:hypothetical protein